VSKVEDEEKEVRPLLVPKTAPAIRFRLAERKIHVSFPTRIMRRPLTVRAIVFFDVSTVRIDIDGKGEAIAKLGDTLYLDYDELKGELRDYEIGVQEMREEKMLGNKLIFARRLRRLFRGGEEYE